MNSPRALFPEEKSAATRALLSSSIAEEAICRRAISECRLVPFDRFLPPLLRGVRPTIAYFALRRRASGITLGRQIYIRRNLFDRDGELPLYLVVHEVAHVVQFLRDGTLPFLSRYVGEYFAGRFRGLRDREAYLAISYEREARRVESHLSRDEEESASEKPF